MNFMEAYIITGISGSGKSTVLKAFEDLDFYCVDNIPTILLPQFFDIIGKYSKNIKKVAVGVDIREKIFLNEFPSIYNQIKLNYNYIKIIFTDADDNIILKRYKETRRVHPLKEKGLKEALAIEREKLNFLKDKADVVINSTEFNVHQLKKFIYNNFSIKEGRKFNINLVSFGFKNGILLEGDLIFDVRFLPNPYFDNELKNKTGLNEEVSKFVFSDNKADIFLDKLLNLLNFLLPLYKEEGKNFIVIGIGCTGGMHRSVAIVEALYNKLKKDYSITKRHRDI